VGVLAANPECWRQQVDTCADSLVCAPQSQSTSCHIVCFFNSGYYDLALIQSFF
jgi:hypothetical protein